MSIVTNSFLNSVEITELPPSELARRGERLPLSPAQPWLWLPVVEHAKTVISEFEHKGHSPRHFYATLQHWIGSPILVDKTTAYTFDRQAMLCADRGFHDAKDIHLVRHLSP
jgi:hypothetical protein